jgi:hypothetical protein
MPSLYSILFDSYIAKKFKKLLLSIELKRNLQFYRDFFSWIILYGITGSCDLSVKLGFKCA